MRSLSEICKSCGACCKTMVLPVVKPLQKAVMLDWLDVRDCQVVRETEDTMYVQVNKPCPQLVKGEDGYTCTIYEGRPEGCKVFDGRKFDFLDCAWKENYVVLEKAGKRGFGMGVRKPPKMGRQERKRITRRQAREERRERREQIRTYGATVSEED